MPGKDKYHKYPLTNSLEYQYQGYRLKVIVMELKQIK